MAATATDPTWLITPDPDPETEKTRRAELTLLVERMSPAELAAWWEWAAEYVPPPPPWEPMPHQIPPDPAEDWLGWLLMGGRGIGKTAAICHAMNAHATGPACLTGPVPHRMGIIAPTLGDASASIVHGEDGLVTLNPDVREVTRKGGTVVMWPNGSYAYLFGTSTEHDVDRLRAHTNRCLDVREELAAWRYLREAQTQADLGLRRGFARWYGATTPRPRPTIKKLDTDPRIRKSSAQTRDNVHLTEARREQLYDIYGNTSIGLQELEGRILEEVTGALWSQDIIEANRITEHEVPELIKVRTYIDPSWGTSHDEVGIIVAGLDRRRHVYILADLSRKCTPSEWGMIAALGYLPRHVNPADPPEPRDFYGRRSERVVAEKNFQGEQVRLVMTLTRKELSRRVQFSFVTASVGKRLRAEPVLWVYERGRVHHVGHYATLEWQMTNWVPPEKGPDKGDPGDPPPPNEIPGQDTTPGSLASTWSPDRLDALVFAVTDLTLSPTGLRWHGRTTMTFDQPEPQPEDTPTPTRELPRAISIPTRTHRLTD